MTAFGCAWIIAQLGAHPSQALPEASFTEKKVEGEPYRISWDQGEREAAVFVRRGAGKSSR